MPSPNVALASLQRQIELKWKPRTEQDAKRLLLKISSDGHKRIMLAQSQREGVIPDWSAYANTPTNLNLQSVKLPGPIVYTYSYTKEIVLAALRGLYRMSPVASGAYRKNHTLYINNVEAAPNQRVKFGDRIFIANAVPYSRRLEVGKTTKGRDFLISVPNKIYERVTKNILIPKYGRGAKIWFGYVTLPEAHVIQGRLPSHYSIGNGRRRKRRQEVGKPVRAPAIFIEGLY